MADAAEGRRVKFPKLDPAHAERVRATLGPLVAIANPLDYHTFIWNNEPAMAATFTAMVSGGFDLNLLVLDFPRGDRCSDADWWPTVNAFQTALKSDEARGAIVASMPENLPEEYCEKLIACGIAPLIGIDEALDAAEAAAFIGEAWARECDFQPAEIFTGASNDLNGSDPDEADAKKMLRDAGLPVPEGMHAASVAEAEEVATLLGYPVAVKALGIAHKSEAGAVRLNLRDPAAVRAAADDLLPLGTGLYVEPMVEGAVAELIVGITRDPLFGPVMTVGIGGVLVELFNDSVTILLPTSCHEIGAALRSLRMYALLEGYRGRPVADREAAVAAILGVARFALQNAGTLEELDINPLIVCEQGKGAWIADALLITRKEQA